MYLQWVLFAIALDIDHNYWKRYFVKTISDDTAARITFVKYKYLAHVAILRFSILKREIFK